MPSPVVHLRRVLHLRKRAFRLWLGLFATLALCAQIVDLSFTRPQADGAENLIAAHNLLQHDVFSSWHRTLAKPDNWREPLQPLVLALAIAVHPGISADEADLGCLLGGTRACQERIAYLKLPSLLLMELAAVLVACAVYGVTRGGWLALACFLAISFSRAYTHAADRFYSEGLAAFLLTVVSVAPLLGAQAERRHWRRFLAWGLAFAALVLTKAVFLYCVPLFFVWVVFLEWRRTRAVRTVACHFAAVALPVVVLVGGWMLRNWWTLESTSLTQRGGLVLYSRVGMNELLFEHRALLTKRYAGLLSQRKFAAQAGPQVLALIDNASPKSFRAKAYARYSELKRTGLDSIRADQALRREAMQKILQRPLRHLAMIVPVGARGMSGERSYGFSASRGQTDKFGRKYLGIHSTVRLLKLPVYASWGIFGSLAACLLVGVVRKRAWLASFVLPSCYVIGIYLLLTHFIPRYATPVLPIAYGASALCVACALRWINTGVRYVVQRARANATAG